MSFNFILAIMPRTLFYHVITREDKEWREIRKVQESGKLPWNLNQVFVYTIPRQYERNVMEMEHWKMLEVELVKAHPFLSISPHYKEIIKHYTCYNPLEGRLHVLLKKYQSLEDLYDILFNQHIFIPPTFYRTSK
jgi:hypothetical protein